MWPIFGAWQCPQIPFFHSVWHGFGVSCVRDGRSASHHHSFIHSCWCQLTCTCNVMWLMVGWVARLCDKFLKQTNNSIWTANFNDDVKSKCSQCCSLIQCGLSACTSCSSMRYWLRRFMHLWCLKWICGACLVCQFDIVCSVSSNTLNMHCRHGNCNYLILIALLDVLRSVHRPWCMCVCDRWSVCLCGKVVHVFSLQHVMCMCTIIIPFATDNRRNNHCDNILWQHRHADNLDFVHGSLSVLSIWQCWLSLTVYCVLYVFPPPCVTPAWTVVSWLIGHRQTIQSSDPMVGVGILALGVWC